MATKARTGLNRLGCSLWLLWTVFAIVSLAMVTDFEQEGGDDFTATWVGVSVLGFLVLFFLLRLLEWIWEGFSGE